MTSRAMQRHRLDPRWVRISVIKGGDNNIFRRAVNFTDEKPESFDFPKREVTSVTSQ
jgi:uncharacterized membrane protein